MTIRLIFAFLITLFCSPLSTQATVDMKEFVHYRDEANGFFVTYPKAWAVLPTTNAKTKLKVLSENGTGTDDFSVVVVSDPSFAQLKPEELVSMCVQRPEEMLKIISREFPDAKMVNSGTTKLNNLDAFFIIYDAIFRSPGLDIPMRFYQVSTVRNGRAYYLTCRSTPDDFDKTYPLFTIIMANFRFLP